MYDNLKATGFFEDGTHKSVDNKDTSKINYSFKPDFWLKNVFDTVEPEIKVMLVNEIFGTNLSLDIEFLNIQTEHNIYNEYKQEKDITRTDTLFVDKNTGEKYNIEFQSTPDPKMRLRLLMYSIYSGIDVNSDEEIVELCNSHVLYTVNSKSNKKGKILSKLRIRNAIIPNKDVQDISITDIDNYDIDDSRIIGVVSGTTELLACIREVCLMH